MSIRHQELLKVIDENNLHPLHDEVVRQERFLRRMQMLCERFPNSRRAKKFGRLIDSSGLGGA
jgi:hypothetical protein